MEKTEHDLELLSLFPFLWQKKKNFKKHDLEHQITLKVVVKVKSYTPLDCQRTHKPIVLYIYLLCSCCYDFYGYHLLLWLSEVWSWLSKTKFRIKLILTMKILFQGQGNIFNGTLHVYTKIDRENVIQGHVQS